MASPTKSTKIKRKNKRAKLQKNRSKKSRRALSKAAAKSPAKKK